MAGVILSTIGLAIAGLYIQFNSSPSIIVLYITVGFLTGLGFGFMYLPAWDIIEVYFDEKLGLATGMAAAGAGVGKSLIFIIINFTFVNTVYSKE